MPNRRQATVSIALITQIKGHGLHLTFTHRGVITFTHRSALSRAPSRSTAPSRRDPHIEREPGRLRSPSKDPRLRHPYNWPESSPTDPARPGSTPGPRPSCCGSRPVRTPARTKGGRDALREISSVNRHHRVWLTTLPKGKVEIADFHR